MCIRDRYGTFILVAWAYYSDKGVNVNNEQIEIIDARKEELHQSANQYEQDQLSFLRIPDTFGNLLQSERFVKHYSKLIEAFYKEPNVHKQMTMISQDDF